MCTAAQLTRDLFADSWVSCFYSAGSGLVGSPGQLLPGWVGSRVIFWTGSSSVLSICLSVDVVCLSVANEKRDFHKKWAI